MNFSETISYIKNNDLDKLIANYKNKSEEYLGGGYSGYRNCQVEYRINIHDYKRIVWNLVIKRLLFGEKPYAKAFINNMDPASYCEKDGQLPTFENAIISLKKNIDIIEQMELCDNKSYDVLSTIFNYRLTGNKNLLFNYINNPQEIYFDREIIPYFKRGWDNIILDCGAFTGDTLSTLMKRKLGKKIYCFEPEPANYMRLYQLGKNMKNVICLNVAVGAIEQDVMIISKGDGSRIGDHGITIKQITIDGLEEDEISFIKMDIEGAELDALHGGEATITRNKPAMAISIYHKLSDVLEVYKYLKNLNVSYKFMVRKYGTTTSELVLYAF